MKYIIQTQNARKLKEEILNSVADKADANGNGIVTWQCVETDGGDKVLVLTEGQWAEKGCLSLTQVVGRNELQVRSYNWGNGVERENGDDKYMFGRFTELLLTHFTYYIDRVIIE
jgi:coproporphyrinogen III oxidase